MRRRKYFNNDFLNDNNNDDNDNDNEDNFEKQPLLRKKIINKKKLMFQIKENFVNKNRSRKILKNIGDRIFIYQPSFITIKTKLNQMFHPLHNFQSSHCESRCDRETR